MRKTRELLARLEALAKEDSEDWIMEPAWNYAAAYVQGMLSMKLELLPPDPAKRNYYGSRGGLRNPHR